MKTKVLIHTTVHRPELLTNCTLTIETLRTGFPTFEAEVHDNSPSDATSEAVEQTARAAGLRYDWNDDEHHGDWIERMVWAKEHTGLAIVILDGDVILWENCEWFQFRVPLAGQYVPPHFSEFYRCHTDWRLHTSFLWINVDLLRHGINLYKQFQCKYSTQFEWIRNDLFLPHTANLSGCKIAFDTCAHLAHAVTHYRFGEQHLSCYDHINGASFYDVMRLVLINESGFCHLHDLAANPQTRPQLRGLYKEINKYYEQRACDITCYINDRAFSAK